MTCSFYIGTVKDFSVKVAEIIEQADTLVGQEIEIEGSIIVIERAKRQIAFASTAHDIGHTDQQQIFIDHSMAELKTIIRPLATMQLMFRGVLTNPPYFYRFDANFRATLIKDKEDELSLSHITFISIDVPYVGKTGELTLHKNYQYQAKIDYTSMPIGESKRTTKAVVISQKKMTLTENIPDETDSIAPDENRYARTIAGQVISLSGWLETLSSQNDIMSHMIVRTSAVRASMVAVGPLREINIIWIRPSALYKLLKSHISASTERPLHQHIEVVGEVDYLEEDDAPDLSPPLKLVFKEIHSIILHEENYLWD
ncbi:MAG: hypothetical protein Phog2KO_18570 [Phototrophicaceae bacterium]